MKCFVVFCFAALTSLGALEIEELNWDEQGPTAHEFNGYLQDAIEAQNWWAVVDYAGILSYHFPTSPFSQDSAFIIGEAYLHLNHPFTANQYFTAYLNTASSPKYFEEAIAHKYQIAERFEHGEKKPLLDSHKGPRWLSAKEDAIQIYDEVIATLPHSEYAVKSLLGKAKLQAENEDYKPSIETLDLLIRRFPKHELTPEAYLEKLRVFLAQCQGKSLDPDLLDLAEVTLRKFRLTFPREERLEEGEKLRLKMEEAFAQNLFDTGSFFEKTKKKKAATIYFQKVVSTYPNTPAAIAARDKLQASQPNP